MSKKPKDHMGKHTGYGLINGKYHIAPLYVEMFDQLHNRRAAVDDVLAAVSTHCGKDYEMLRAEQRRVWDLMGEDFGVDFRAGEWTYLQGVISPAPKKENK